MKLLEKVSNKNLFIYWQYNISMAKDNRIHLPSSGGGLVRYSEEVGAKIKVQPYIIIAIIVVVIILGIVLYKGF